MVEKCKCGAMLDTSAKKKIIRCAKCAAVYLLTKDLFGNYEYHLISK